MIEASVIVLLVESTDLNFSDVCLRFENVQTHNILITFVFLIPIDPVNCHDINYNTYIVYINIGFP